MDVFSPVREEYKWIMNINLTGKSALIGGSSKGLGLAIARQLAVSGANVTLMARNKTTLKKVVDQLDTVLKIVHLN